MTTRRSVLFFFIPAVILVLGIAYYFGGHKTPANQPPLSDLNSQSIAAFREQFNRDSDKVRVILLLSPT